MHGLRPIFLIKQLGEGCSYLPACFHSTGKGETATNWLIGDVGYVASGKDDCVLPAGSRLACLSMVMHSLVFKNASFKIHRCRKRLKRWIPSCDQQRSGDSEEAGGGRIYQKCFLTGRRSLRKDSEVSSFLMVEVTGHQDRPYQGLLGEKKREGHMFKGIFQADLAFVCLFLQ